MLVEEVARLDEPFRSAILLRYFDGLAHAEIAARMNCPEATVRSRVKRGLGRLRERMDVTHDGGRGAWTAALVPVAAASPGVPTEAHPQAHVPLTAASAPAARPLAARWAAVGLAAAALVAVAILSRPRGGLGAEDAEARLARTERTAVGSGSSSEGASRAAGAADPVPSRPRAGRADRTAGGDTVTPPVPGRAVTGRVVDPDGQPVAGAQVRVTAVVAPAETPEGGASSRTGAADAAADPAARTTAASGDAPNHSPESAGPSPEVAADERGEFTVPGVPAGLVRLSARAPGHLAGEVVADATGGDVTGLTVTLARAHVLRGTVTAADGGSLAGVRVAVRRATSGTRQFRSASGGGPAVGNLVWVPLGTVAPDDGGRWSFPLEWDRGSFQVAAHCPGRLDSPESAVTLRPGVVPAEIRLVLPEAGGLTGTVVTAADGSPVPRARITIAPLVGLRLGPPDNSARSAPVSIVADGEGAFRAGPLIVGRYLVTAEAQGFAAGSARARAPGSVRVELPPAGTRTISGRVRFPDGTPAHPYEVFAMGEYETHSPRNRTSTAPDGTFAFGDVDPGVYRVRASRGTSPAGADGLPAEVGSVAAGTTGVDIVVERGRRIVGRVEDEAGRPVARAPVNAMPDAPGTPGRVPSGFTYSGDDGRFEVVGLADAAYALVVHAPMERAGEFPIARVPGLRPGGDGVTVVMRPGLTISGRVLGPGGEPLGRGSVRAMPEGPGADPEPVSWQAGRVGTDGRFVVSGLVAGVYRLQLLGFDSRLAPAGAVQGPTRPPSLLLHGGERVTAGARDVEIRADPGLHISGQVAGDDGTAVAGAQVWVIEEGTKDTVMLYSGTDGAFDCFGLEPGRTYRVEAYRAGWRARKLTDVRAGGDPLTLTMVRGVTVTGRVTDLDGSPVASSRLEFVPLESPTPFDLGHAETGEDGRFVAGALDDRAYRVRVGFHLPGTRDVRWVFAGTVRGGDRDVTLRLER